MDWGVLLDKIKVKNGLTTEFELAFFLFVPPATIGHMRGGSREPSIQTVCKILDKGGYVFTKEMLLSMVPDAAVSFKKWESACNRKSFNVPESEGRYLSILGDDGNVDWRKAMDIFKVKRHLSTDKDLAQALRVAAARIGDVRNSSRPLACAAKIIMFTVMGIHLNKITLAQALPSKFQSAINEGHLSLDSIFTETISS